MSITVNYNNMMQHMLGDKGISQLQLDTAKQWASHCHASVEKSRGVDMQGWMDSPYCPTEQLDAIIACASRIRNNYDNFVVLGIGGSALGPIAVHQALNHLYYNELPASKRGPKFYCIDNADPERMNALFDVIDLDKTVFNVITKSGSTSETMSQYLIVMDKLTTLFGDKAKEHIIATTSRDKGNLIKLAQQEGFETFYIEDGVGGRFSQLSPVGLLPASVVGIDIVKMLSGARHMDKLCSDNSDIYTNPALMGALMQYISIEKGQNISVMMPYADSLKYIADWYCQLWAESLGKAVDNRGKVVHVGQTPVKSLGVTDQHSQVQLYAEGPFDKVITFVEVSNFRSSVTIPDGCEQFANVNFLCGHTLDELMSKELFATRYALTQAHRANYTITLDGVDEFNIGALLYMLQMQTAYMGAMLDINTYNQPGVEGGKDATYALFGRQGYETKAEELSNTVADQQQFIIG